MATTATTARATASAAEKWFQAFKYCVYALLAINIFMFLHEEWLAASQVFSDGLSAGQIVSAFAQSIDTAAWVLLLLLFELETFVLADRALSARQRLALHAVRVFCYLFIVYAFYGYVTNLVVISREPAAGVADLCAPGGPAVFLIDFYEYVTVTAENCGELPGAGPLYALPAIGAGVVTDAAHLSSARGLAWADAINAGDWLLIVLLLELDVRLKTRGALEGWRRRVSEGVKVVLYGVLLACAIYWWFAGDFIDFWDAFLWLVAFVFIEMNVFGFAETKTPPP